MYLYGWASVYMYVYIIYVYREYFNIHLIIIKLTQ